MQPLSDHIQATRTSYYQAFSRAEFSTKQLEKDFVWAIIAEDPFYLEQVADYDVLEFMPTKAAAELERYLV